MPRKTDNAPVRTQRIADAWKTIAPEATFAGMTREQFETRVKPALDVREQLASLDSQRIAKVEQRDDADRAALEVTQMVINAIKGDPNYGPDHPLLQSMGYVRKSARWSGLTRKSNGNGHGNEAQATATAATAV